MKPNLPTETDTIFWVIVIVFFSIFLGGLTMSAPILMWPVILSMVVLSARAVLAGPDKELTAHEDALETAELKESGVWQKIQTAITEMAQEIGYTRPIRLVISKQPLEARAFGSWRRHYILLGRMMAEKLAADLDNPDHRAKARALLVHEIAHIANRDVQRISYTRELLRTCVTVLPWWTLLLIGWLSMAMLSGEALIEFDLRQIPELEPQFAEFLTPLVSLSPEQKGEIADKIETISFRLLMSFILNAFLPIIMMGFVLWLFFWRRMLRIREYYADQQAVAAVKNPEIVKRAMAYYGIVLRLKAKSQLNTNLPRWRQWLTVFSAPSGFVQSVSQPLWLSQKPTFWARLQQWFATHPTNQDRWRCQADSAQIHSDWKGTAWSTAVLVLALDVMLTTPLIGYHLTGYPIHVSSILTFLLVSGWMLPQIVHRKSIKKEMAKMLVIIFGLRWIWLALNLGVIVILSFFAPLLGLDLWNIIVFSQSGFAGIPSEIPITDPLFTLRLIPEYIGLQAVQMFTVFALLWGYYVWQQNKLQQEPVANWSTRHWRGVLVFSLVAVFVVLTPATDLLGGDLEQLIRPSRLASYILGAFLLVSIFIPPIHQRLFGEIQLER
jgi:Zn-dependent protease with chaperone function